MRIDGELVECLSGAGLRELVIKVTHWRQQWLWAEMEMAKWEVLLPALGRASVYTSNPEKKNSD